MSGPPQALQRMRRASPRQQRKLFIMADSDPTPAYMTTREASALADHLSRCGGRHSVAARIATMETQCRQAARLIRAMLRQVHSSDVFKLPPEE
jgi:hypothetical protein